MPGRRTASVAVGSLALVLTQLMAPTQAATTAPAGVSAETASAARLAAPPRIGECHNLTWGAAMADSDNSAAVPCAEAHTTRVVAVGRLPGGVTWSDRAKFKYKSAVEAQCRAGWDQAVGGTHKERHLSAFRMLVFIPTDAQQQSGARWFRCDAAVQVRTSLQELPSKVPLLRSPLKKRQRGCLTGKGLRTVCTDGHTFRAAYTPKFKMASWPGKRKVRRKAEKRCAARSQGHRFAYTFPTRAQWSNGERHAVCFTS